MGTAKPASTGDRLSRLMEQCELLPGCLGRRQTVLDEMRSLGFRIDAAYASFVKSPKTAVDQQRLGQAQSEIQTHIERRRSEADGLMTQWWELYNAIGVELTEAAKQAPVLLPALEDSSRLPMPGGSSPKLEVLRLRELLGDALSALALGVLSAAPRESKESYGTNGLLTAKETAAALGISHKTVYRLAKEGRIPYVRIHSSLRFRQTDVASWLESKSFRPAGMKKATPGKGTVVDNATKR